jgi:hypothetical protein
MIKDNKQRLFEMINRVGDMPLAEEATNMPNLPVGISPDDFIPLKDYIEQVPCSTGVNEIDDPNEFGAKMSKVSDIQKLLVKKDAEISNKHQNYNTGGRICGDTMDDVRINDKNFDIEKLKKILLQKPNTKQFPTQNKKMGMF